MKRGRTSHKHLEPNRKQELDQRKDQAKDRLVFDLELVRALPPEMPLSGTSCQTATQHLQLNEFEII